jgi:hypothetical protein
MIASVMSRLGQVRSIGDLKPIIVELSGKEVLPDFNDGQIIRPSDGIKYVYNKADNSLTSIENYETPRTFTVQYLSHGVFGFTNHNDKQIYIQKSHVRQMAALTEEDLEYEEWLWNN